LSKNKKYDIFVDVTDYADALSMSTSIYCHDNANGGVSCRICK